MTGAVVLGATLLTTGASAHERERHRPAAGEVIAGELAIDLRDDLTDAEVAAFGAELALEDYGPNSEESRVDHIERARTHDMAGTLARLRGDPRVEHAEAMSVYTASWVPNDPQYVDQWHMQRVGAERAWDFSCGRGVTVAVVDTGIACYDADPFHKGSDLQGTQCTAGWNFVDDQAQAWDDQGHGTHVAGTIAQTTDNGAGVSGISHCSRLMPVKVLNEYGWGSSADVAQGIRWAATHGASVINLSLGSAWRSELVEAVVAEALGKKVVVVAAAGNSAGSVGYPAAFPGVIAVAATNRNDALAPFSNRGPEIALAAPGVDVLQQTICNGGHDACELFASHSGTSMASPHVAGAAALLVGMGVSDPAAVRATLLASARAVDAPSLGAGVLDAGAATRRVAAMQLVARVAILLGLGLWLRRALRRTGRTARLGPLGFAFAAFAGVGLLAFAPFVGLAPHAPMARLLVELGARPFGEWDVLASATAHRWLPLANALPTIAFAALGFGHRTTRTALAGFALGSAALMLQLALFAEVATVAPVWVMRVWLVLHALLAYGIAKLACAENAR
jgi:serine protease